MRIRSRLNRVAFVLLPLTFLVLIGTIIPVLPLELSMIWFVAIGVFSVPCILVNVVGWIYWKGRDDEQKEHTNKVVFFDSPWRPQTPKKLKFSGWTALAGLSVLLAALTIGIATGAYLKRHHSEPLPQAESRRHLTPEEIDAIVVPEEQPPAYVGTFKTWRERQQERQVRTRQTLADRRSDEVLDEMRRANDIAEQANWDRRWEALDAQLDAQRAESEPWQLRYNYFEDRWRYAPTDASLRYNYFEDSWEFVPTSR